MERTTRIAAPLVFVSGFCALIYQVVWTRELRLVFGASTAASSAVIAIFIAGLGFGGLWFGRRVERSGRPLGYYAALELAIALSSAISPWLIDLVQATYALSGGSPALGIAGSSVVRLLLATLVLGPPTFLMGGTLPAVARAIETDSDLARRGVAAIYGLNTLGAVLGCTLSTFVLLERFGSRATLYLACGLNLLVALGARLGSAWLEAGTAASAPGSSQPAAAVARTPSEPAVPRGLVFASAAIVGFAFFMMELVWYRMLAPLLGGTVFTFGLILAVALAGIGLGSAVYATRLSGRRALPLGFALTCAAEAACIALPYALGDRIAVWTLLLRSFGALGFPGLMFGWTAIAVGVIFPAAFLAGIQFPMLIALLGGGREHVGRDLGAAYAWNTLGAVAGALAGGFGLMRLLGALGCWRLASMMLALWGAVVAGVALRRKAARLQSAWVFALAALTGLLLLAEGPTAVWRHAPIGAGRVTLEAVNSPNQVQAFMNQQRAQVAWQTDGIESALAVGTHDGLAFVVNGKTDGNARTDAPTQVMGALVGAALMPSVKRAMVIGLGTGSTAGWLARVPEIERVDVAEIEPAILQVAASCALANEGVLDNPKVRVQRGDARELLAVSRERYDLIFSEPSNPYRAGVASLYTREFYAAVRERLAPNGLFVQWLQAYDVDSQTTRTIYATLGAEFPHVETWNGLKHDLLLVASRNSLVHDTSALRARVTSEPFDRAMRVAWATDGLEGFLAHYVASSAFTRTAASGWPVLNTDDKSPVEFGFARNLSGGPRDSAESMFQTIRARGQHRPQLRGVGDIDWDRVDFEREAFALLTSSGHVMDHLTPGYQVRLNMLMSWLAADHASALARWNQLGNQAGTLAPVLIERLALAEIFAYSTEATAEGWIATLTEGQPVLGPAMRALWLSNNGRRMESTDALELALAAYRVDPWPVPWQMARALAVMRVSFEGDRALVPRWLAALSQPFAIHVNEAARLQARVDLVVALGAHSPACIDVLTEMEPHFPWSGSLLDFRLACYDAHDHPLRDRAAREVLRFRAAAPVPFDVLLAQ